MTPDNREIFLAIQPRCAIILKHGKTTHMKKKPQVIIYILLNIIISAATILFVMWLWDRSQPNPTALDNDLTTLTTEDMSSTDLPTNSTTRNSIEPTDDQSSSENDVEIETIVGPGDLEIEFVEISNNGQSGVDLTGWQLIDEDGQIFTFPTFILNNGGEVKILSQNGIDTVIELYWQSDIPIWESGETAQLLDQNGTIISTYSIP